jgi:cell division protein FtsB
MQKINIRKIIYHIRHDYLTMNNVVIVVALVIGASWAWGSVGMMQRNFALQKEVDARKREMLVAELEVKSLEFEQKYYKSTEYQELAVRERLGLVRAGEKVLFLPLNSVAAQTADEQLKDKKVSVKKTQEISNFQQWVNFLFGGNSNRTR